MRESKWSEGSNILNLKSKTIHVVKKRVLNIYQKYFMTGSMFLNIYSDTKVSQ